MNEAQFTEFGYLLILIAGAFATIWIALNAIRAVYLGLVDLAAGVKRLYAHLQRIAQEGAQLEADQRMHVNALRNRAKAVILEDRFGDDQG